jgi:hypothetical protein
MAIDNVHARSGHPRQRSIPASHVVVLFTQREQEPNLDTWSILCYPRSSPAPTHLIYVEI